MRAGSTGVARLLKAVAQPWSPPPGPAPALGLMFLIVMLWDLLLVFDGHSNPSTRGLALWVTVVGYPVLVFGCALAVTHRRARLLERLHLQRLLVVAPAVVAIGLITVGIGLPALLRPTAPINDDVTASIICASQDVLGGHDPYLTPELACLHRLSASPVLGTPLREGVFLHQRTYPTPEQILGLSSSSARSGFHTPAFAVFGYPPLSCVWMLPAAWSDHSGWVALTLSAAGLWLLAVGFLAGELWPAVVLLMLLQFGDGSVIGAATQGDGEFFPYALAILALILIDRPRWSASCLALAVASNPLAWPVALGYLALAARLPRLRQRLTWLAGTLLIVLTPWVLLERGVVAGVVGLILQKNFPSGIGLVALLGPGPPNFLRYVLVTSMAMAFVGWCGLTLRHPRWLPTVPVLATAFLWISWRSDVNYLAQVFPLAVAMIVGLHRLESFRDPPQSVCGTPPGNVLQPTSPAATSMPT